jgi:hypothetical protein
MNKLNNLLFSKKSQRIIKYLVAIVLIVLIYLSYNTQNRSSSIRSDKKNFEVSDTTKIERIELSNRNLQMVSLRRSVVGWTLNDTLFANQSSVNLILKTIKEMRVKNPIARSALKNVIERMGIQNTKVEIFSNSKKIRTIYIGGETADQLGTFMMLEGAKEPYVVHIPGFNGYLSSRFHCRESDWRDKNIFRNLKNISYFNPSINVENSVKSKWSTTDIKHLKNIYCEKFLDLKLFNDVIDRESFLIFKVIDEKDNEEFIYLKRKKPPNKEKYKMNKYDMDRFYALYKNNLMLVQYKQFNDFIASQKSLLNFTPN